MLIKNNWCSNSELYFKIQNKLHLSTLHKEIIKDIEHSKPKTILDYGGGDGSLLDRLGLEHFKGFLYDTDPIALKIARKTVGINDNLTIVDNLNSVKEVCFDAIILCNVLMCVNGEEKIIEILKEIKRLKNSEGVLYLGMTHPCYIDKKFNSYSNDFIEGNLEFDYFDNGKPYNVYYQFEEEKIIIKDFFWNLSRIFSFAKEADLIIKDIIEIDDKNNNYSPFIMLKLI